MKIKKVLNNNAVTVLNDRNEEIVVMGLGLAFKKKSGDELDDAKVEKIFTLENKDVNEKLIKLISEIPPNCIETTEEIIKYAENYLGKKLNSNLYLTLTDHIAFALTRYRQGMNLKNPMLWEIKSFYPQEYSIGIKALEMILNRLNTKLEEDEAGYIALHIVNAQLNTEINAAMDITNIVQDILSIIRYHFGITLDESSLNYHRLITHLKFFAQRILTHNLYKEDDNCLYDIVKDKYSAAHDCAERIKTYVQKNYDYIINEEEMTYLTIHIQRVVNRN